MTCMRRPATSTFPRASKESCRARATGSLASAANALLAADGRDPRRRPGPKMGFMIRLLLLKQALSVYIVKHPICCFVRLTFASDFDLVKADSPAVDAGADVADNALDYFNRARPNGSAPDIGAMEFGSAQIECIPRFPAVSIWPPSGPVQLSLDSILPAMHRRGLPELQRKWSKNCCGTASRTVNPHGLWLRDTDPDGDGVTDDIDQCPNSILGPTIIIDSCDSGVRNPISPIGCTISDEIQSLANSAGNRRQFVGRVTPYLSKLLREGIITKSQKDAIRKCASTSSVP
jgi:hypothetical protein